MATATTVTARLAALRSTIDDTVTDALRTSPMTYGGRGVYPTNDREFFRVCRAMGFATSKREGEYRICPNGCGEAAAYHTTDRRDAFDTAQAIATDMAHQRESGRTAACLRGIVADMDAEQLAAFDPLTFAVPCVDAVGIVAAEKVRRASVVARMDAARDAGPMRTDGSLPLPTFGAPRELHVINVVLVALDGLTMSAQVTQRVHPSVLDASAWEVAAEWCRGWRRDVRPVFVVIAAQDGSWCARYDVADDGTGDLSRVPAQKVVR
jgi:hypothetical protein